jgi:hypothetical protein
MSGSTEKLQVPWAHRFVQWPYKGSRQYKETRQNRDEAVDRQGNTLRGKRKGGDTAEATITTYICNDKGGVRTNVAVQRNKAVHR